MAEEAKEQQQQDKRKRRGTILTAIIVAAVALIEGGLFFIAIKWMGGGPGVAHGVEDNYLDEAEVAQVKTVEVPLVQDMRVINSQDGTLTTYVFDVTVVIPSDNEQRLEDIKAALESRRAAISDRIQQIIRGQSPRVLQREPDLQTVRLQVQQAITEVLRDPDAVTQVLFPRYEYGQMH